jgi:hypothetical protein
MARLKFVNAARPRSDLMADPLAQFDEVRPNGRRHFELFADRVIVDSRSAKADCVITVLLADLRAEPNIVRVRPKEFNLGVGSLLIGIVLGFVAFTVGAMQQPANGKSMIWVGASAAFLVASLAIVAKTIRKIEFTQFVSNQGKPLLDVARAGPQRAGFDSFIEAVTDQIRAVADMKKKDPGPNPYTIFRNRAFSCNRPEIGIAQPPASAPAWGALMEIVVPNGVVVTLLSLADGTTSLYFSSGFTVIGGHSHQNVRQASAMFLAKTNELLDSTTPAQRAPLPEFGRVAFFARTDDGLRTANFAESELKTGSHAFSPLFFAGHIVIGELRKTSQTQPAAAG